MDFLGVGPLELILVLIIAILVIGPRDIGKTAKTIGRFLNRVYKSDEWRALTEASRSLRTLPNRLAREAELEELTEITKTIKDTTEDLTKSRDQLIKDTKTNIASLTLNPSEEADAMKAWTMPPDEGGAKSGNSDTSLAEEDKTGTEES
jgi:Sec-independent protein translocase protein TatA